MKQLTSTNAWPIRVKIMELVKTQKEASNANVLKDGKGSFAMVNKSWTYINFVRLISSAKLAGRGLKPQPLPTRVDILSTVYVY